MFYDLFPGEICQKKERTFCDFHNLWGRSPRLMVDVGIIAYLSRLFFSVQVMLATLMFLTPLCLEELG